MPPLPLVTNSASEQISRSNFAGNHAAPSNRFFQPEYAASQQLPVASVRHFTLRHSPLCLYLNFRQMTHCHAGRAEINIPP